MSGRPLERGCAIYGLNFELPVEQQILTHTHTLARINPDHVEAVWDMGQSRRGLRATNKGQDSGDDDVKRQVDSDNKNEIPIYRLVNVKNGGGKLVDIIKATARTSGSGSFKQNSLGGQMVSEREHSVVSFARISHRHGD